MNEQLAAKVLIVDDEPNIRELLSEALELNGFVVRTAADGRQALEAVARQRPDIIVLDVMMPGLDGFTIARKPREAGDSPMMLFLRGAKASL